MSRAQPRTADIVFYAPSTIGGLYEHTRYQADALTRLGFNVHVVTCPNSTNESRVLTYTVSDFLDKPKMYRSKIARRLAGVWTIRKNLIRATKYCLSTRAPIFFLESFFEYGSPFWSGILRQLAARGICIGVNLHDPVRDFQIGPRWWHELSVANAWKPISFALAHQSIPSESRVPHDKVVSVVPVGVYKPNSKPLPKRDALMALGIPTDQPVFLFFGFIRDNKNLDLAIRALSSLPQGRLIVAGNSQSSRDKNLEFYKSLANDVGVTDRVRFDTAFIEESQIGVYFSACDAVLLTYSSEFRSQSGVLNIAANYRTPVIASSGESPLIECVERFKLGKVILPDNVDRLADAMKEVFAQNADWDGYAKYATWETNVEPLANKIREIAGNAE